MGRLLHGSATTTEAIRRTIRNSKEALRELSKRYGINHTTVAKWRKPNFVVYFPTRPKERRSTVPSVEEKAAVFAFRKHTLLPLDDCLYALQPTTPHLTSLSLDRCFQRTLVAAFPYKIHNILTDNGSHFTDPGGDGWTPAEIKAMLAEKVRFLCHSFGLARANLDIEYRLNKPHHPWTNGQVERMNWTLKDAAVKRLYFDDHAQLRSQV